MGWAITGAQQRQDFALMREMGVNAVRLGHYQQDQLVYDLADRLGLLVLTEIPLVDSAYASTAFADNAQS